MGSNRKNSIVMRNMAAAEHVSILSVTVLRVAAFTKASRNAAFLQRTNNLEQLLL